MKLEKVLLVKIIKINFVCRRINWVLIFEWSNLQS